MPQNSEWTEMSAEECEKVAGGGGNMIGSGYRTDEPTEIDRNGGLYGSGG